MFDWVGGVLEWFLDVISQIFTAAGEMIKDLGVLLLEVVLDLFLLIISYLQAPAFLAEGLQSYLGALDPAVIYFLSQSGLTTGLNLIGAGVVFRLTRKLLTLGQW